MNYKYVNLENSSVEEVNNCEFLESYTGRISDVFNDQAVPI